MNIISPKSRSLPESIEETIQLLAKEDYLCDRQLATTLFLSLRLARPIFLEGEPGVGKTELAKSLAKALGTELFRIQCYEGLDVAQSAYEWNVAKQMVEIRLAESSSDLKDPQTRKNVGDNLYSREMLIERPLLQSLTQSHSPVLLIDELDRADEPFDAFLLEILAENQMTIPEFGLIRATSRPITIITSNRTREIHDALKRRCLYHWLDFPTLERELEIIHLRAPGSPLELYHQVVAFVQEARKLNLYKPPGIAETIDWTQALAILNTIRLSPDTVNSTLGVLLKNQEDINRLQAGDTIKLLTELVIKGYLPDPEKEIISLDQKVQSLQSKKDQL